MARYRDLWERCAPDLSGISIKALVAIRENLVARREFLRRNHQAAGRLCDKFQHDISKLEQEILALRRNSTNQAPLSGVFRSGLTSEAKAVLDGLELQIAKLRGKLGGKPYRLEGIKYQSLQHMAMQLFNDIQSVEGDIQSVNHRIDQVSASLQRQEQAAERERKKAENELKKAQAVERKRAKTEQRDAMAKAYAGKTREQADIIRRQLPRDHPCPYCFCALDARAHADHIHPVSRGGLSTARNMVYACSGCNQLKSNLTLIQFIWKFKRDAKKISQSLLALGKDI